MIYLDTSCIVPLFLPERRSVDIENMLVGREFTVSDLARAEFSSAIALAVRSGRVSTEAARTVLTRCDEWADDHAWTVDTAREDFTVATSLIRRFDLGLRTPDALHIAIARRLGAALLTFDTRMHAAALSLGVDTLG